jgi:hypothetical protein
MPIKITKTENDGFTADEVGYLMSTFVTTVKNLKIELAGKTAWLEVVELKDSNITIVITLKELNKQRQWEGKAFARNNQLKIFAIEI